MTAFRTAKGTGSDWREAARTCLEHLGDVHDAGLGLVYLTAPLAEDAASIVTLLRSLTGIEHWTGATGAGIVIDGEEIHDRPAIAVMTCPFAPDALHIIPHLDQSAAPLITSMRPWLAHHTPQFALVHADPRNPDLPQRVAEIAELCGSFAIGGLTAARPGMPHIADTVHNCGISGVVFDTSASVATGLTQACSPIGPVRTITRAEGNVIHRIDDRPALDVFEEEIGEVLARDMRRTAGYIFAALPVGGSDLEDYLVRTIVAVDVRDRWIAIGETVPPGGRILFTRRDGTSAREDMNRMLDRLASRISAPPAAALYMSCLARGENTFGPGSIEATMIRERFGDIPTVGMFANGEIAGNRLYAYTGVLTLFLQR